MALGDALRQRLEELQARIPVVQQMFYDIAQGATMRAVEEAKDHTPPNGDEKDRGTGPTLGERQPSGPGRHWGRVSYSSGQQHPVR